MAASADPSWVGHSRPVFQTPGPSWTERARFGEREAVLSPNDERLNAYLNGMQVYAANVLCRQVKRGSTLLDFGCGTGRFLRFFGARGYRVIGTEVTAAMLDEARRYGLPANATLHLTDGVELPIRNESVDAVWACGVLKYCLTDDGAVLLNIAREFRRVLKPEGVVVAQELYIQSSIVPFLVPFSDAGFHQQTVAVLHDYNSRIDQYARHWRMPTKQLTRSAQIAAAFSQRVISPWRNGDRLRDYLFVWRAATR
jgi:SAM-dependent methyltransferase